MPKCGLFDVGKEAAQLQTKQEALVKEAMRQDDQLKGLQNETDNAVRTLLNDAHVLKYQTKDERKHLAKEAKQRKIIQSGLYLLQQCIFCAVQLFTY